MEVSFFIKDNGRSPVLDCINSLQKSDKSRIYGCLDNVERMGFDASRVSFRQIRGKMWEIKIRANNQYRIFYASVSINEIVLLHMYRKQTQKAPVKEIEIAEKRMMELFV